MKNIIGVCIVGLLILLCCIMSLNILNKQADTLSSHIAAVEKDIDAENWNAAASQYAQFKKKWNYSISIWSMMIDHIEIDNINIVLAELEPYLKEKEKNQALSCISALKMLIKHVPDREALKLKNVL